MKKQREEKLKIIKENKIKKEGELIQLEKKQIYFYVHQI